MAAHGPHANERVEFAGAPLDSADAAVIMVHGRGAAPKNILDLLRMIDRPRIAYVAPAAANGTWYPLSFLAPREQNEPFLGSALSVVESLVERLVQRLPSEKIGVLGFSQGACLTCEFVLRHPRRYGGVFALTGGLIGPPGTSWDDATESLEGTPIFLGASDIDAHVPKERVIETATVFTRLGARVTQRLYPGMGHIVNEDEIAIVQRLLDAMAGQAG